ncbi:MAG: nucleotidyltransferase domain-containing protein [Caldilineales bacterium]|nr:nucleotidyltransferase domain-containing protein [Caldilineales bacterium]
MNASRLLQLRPSIRQAIAAYRDRIAAQYADEVVTVILYGSQARGHAHPESDIDLLVVTRQDSPVLRQMLADLAWDVQFEHHVIISDLVRSLDQWQQMQRERFPFYQSIEREGVIL